jgi:CRP/FNR family transcriptional regulator, cyclic AMP receptor protein
LRKALFLLGTLNDGDIDWMATTGTRKKVQAGDHLIVEGVATDHLYFVLDGACVVRAAGRELAQLHSGEILGEISFVDARNPTATVSALEDSVFLAIPRVQLDHKLQADVAFAARFYRALAVFLADRLRSTLAGLSGKVAQDESDEMDVDMLDRVALASARFDWMLNRLRGH